MSFYLSLRKWSLLLFVFCIMLFTGCFLTNTNSSNDSSEPVVTSIFSTEDYSVYSVRPSWAPGAKSLIFSGSQQASTATIWKVSASAGSAPVHLGGESAYCPSFLASGKIVFYTGWLGTDLNMHIMRADSGQTAPLFTASILHSFNGTDIGKAANHASSPMEMSVSDDGLKAFIIWSHDSAYVLNWNSADSLINVVKVDAELTSGQISPDGATIAYSTTAGKIAWEVSEGGIQYTIENGYNPTWDSSSNRLGYVNGSIYTIYNFTSKDSKSYTISAIGTNPVLSPGADKVAYRTFAGAANGIAVAELN